MYHGLILPVLEPGHPVAQHQLHPVVHQFAVQQLGHLEIKGCHHLGLRLHQCDLRSGVTAGSPPFHADEAASDHHRALHAAVSSWRIRSASGTVHKVVTRGESMPGMGGRRGEEPMASTRVS